MYYRESKTTIVHKKCYMNKQLGKICVLFRAPITGTRMDDKCWCIPYTNVKYTGVQ